MDKDNNDSSEEIQNVTAEPTYISSQAQVSNIFESRFND